MVTNSGDIFKCGKHDFSTSDITKWDAHCKEFEHTYDLHDNCACGCGEQIHVLPRTKLDPSARRIPRGHMAEKCKVKIKEVEKIKEPGEIARSKK